MLSLTYNMFYYYLFSLEIILRNENVETVQAGDRYDFTGTLIVVPDVSVMSTPSARAESASGQKRGDAKNEGVKGLKCLGIRDLNYRLAFLACSLSTTDSRVIIFNRIIYSK